MAVLLLSSPVAAHFRAFTFAEASPEQRLFFINVASASLALALAMMSMPLLAGTDKSWYLDAIAVVSTLCIAGLFAVCVRLRAKLVFFSEWTKQKKTARHRPTLVLVAVWAGACALAIAWAGLFAEDPSEYGLFFAYRTLHLASGVSPVMPMLFLLAVAYVWGVFEVWRLRFNENSRPRLATRPPFPGAEIAGHSTEIDTSTAVSKFQLKGSYLIGLIGTYLLWLFALRPFHPFHLFEKAWFGRTYEIILLIVVAMMLSKGFRMALCWSALRRLLFELDRSRIRLAFSRLKGFSWSPIWRQGGEEAEWVFMSRSLEALRYLGRSDMTSLLEPDDGPIDPELKEIHEGVRSILKDIKAGGDRSALRSRLDGLWSKAGDMKGTIGAADACKPLAYAALEKELSAVTAALDLPVVAARTDAQLPGILKAIKQTREQHEAADQPAPTLERALAALQTCLAVALNRCLDILDLHWSKPAAHSDDSESPEKEDHVTVHCGKDEPSPGAMQVHLLEEFAALRYVSFIRAVLAYLRHSLIFLAISFSLVLLSLNVYSFEPHRSLLWSFTAMFVVIGFMIVTLLMQVHRDPILSRITGTTPNDLGLAFYVRIFSIGVVPLLALLSAHFPAIGRSLVSALQPGLEALK
jgi:hypothetical protein